MDRHYLMLVLDVFLVISSYLPAYVLRFEGQIPPGEWQNLREDDVSGLHLDNIIS